MRSLLIILVLIIRHALAVVISNPSTTVPSKRQIYSAYAPINVTCPSSALVRSAGTTVSSAERNYIDNRKPLATGALASWLNSLNANFSTANLPSVGLTTSGGGYRSLLCGAGAIQAFDNRESPNSSVASIYQSLVYQAGLSGGAWLLSSQAGNNWPTITSLKTGLWEAAFQNSLLLPGGPAAAAADDGLIANDIVAKNDAGFPPTLTDPWGRLLSYQLLYGTDGGVADTLSGVTSNSEFTSYNVPYPIITAIEVAPGQCLPALSNPQFETHPYEFGSWDSGISAFTQTAYLGTPLSNGEPTGPSCIEHYDNLGYVLGTSSNLFSEACTSLPAINLTNPLYSNLSSLLPTTQSLIFRDEFAVYPNPFHNYPSSPSISSQTELYLVDGGLSNQNNPIWPFIQAARGPGTIDILLVNDNSADTSDNFPNGTEIYNTYVRAQQVGLTRMPVIPPVSTFVSQGLNKRATFFGCNSNSTLTIIYLPNVNYTYPSNQPTAKLQYSVAETDAMIANGVLIGTQDNDAAWPVCLGCAMVKKAAAALPSACVACFTKYCFN
jgi:lysophospholipase